MMNALRSPSSVFAELSKLNELKSQGVINDAEYEDLKRKALA